ncbi:hypothetical protein EHV15_35005 [Paenibacillus oralis]|uniref:HTH LytTR-type domain-containing protein n=1 Tax=Paenibacillus oralis TaxID=2490856 RepID=A0A3P3TA20_9BACL|nr:LytTR family transcriptional regulator DNA-binding domain-containing protein [Paenibacillus oralis]RRJ54800.1 hypothetical protein EHV15_35005 [Paenibacillus oralis]
MEWNRTLAVTKDADGKSGLFSLSVDDILFFRIVSGRLIAHTSTDKYYLVGGEKINRFLSALNSSGCHFYRSDRGDIPDITKIRKFNKDWARAYFTDCPDAKSKFIYISRHRFNEFVELTMKHNAYIRELENQPQ